MIPASLYSTVYLYVVILLTFYGCSTIGNNYAQIKRGNNTNVSALLICLIFAVWLGMRPISGRYFGDTSNYARIYNFMRTGIGVQTDGGEWVWNNIMYMCAQVMDVSDFFTIIDLAYFGFTYWACRRFTPNNTLVSVLFCLGSLSFYTYGTNGIRNGLACSITLVVLSYLTGNTKDKIIAGVLAFIAFNIHHSTALPIGMAVISLFFISSFKTAYTFWILSILISLVAGGAVAALFASFGFDDRVSYLTSVDAEQFSHNGFRWDFLLYSMMPIVLGYYIVMKKGIEDKFYMFLLNTYTLANAFWVMVIRANFSNRFAYLSWFMYPIVLAYPLLKLDIWGEEQGRYAKNIMLAQIGFTWFMQTFYWS